MSKLKRNIIANFGGSVWAGLMQIVFVPFYIRFMGAESYGLIGIFTTLQMMFILLDMGISTTLNREMASLSVLPGREQEMRNLVRTLEIVYWFIAFFIGIAITIISPFIANQWVKVNHLSPQTVEHALRIMGFAMAFQWPAAFYSGGLIGLQRQVLLNAIIITVGTLRGAGSVLILWLISPTIQAFFSWQIVVSIINTGLLAFFLWHRLPYAENKACFQRQLFAKIWRFAAGMSGISILATILTQLDKIILSKMLTLEMFGYYTLAGSVGMSLYRVIAPIFTAVYPRFTQLVALADNDGLKDLYHKSCQLMSVLIFPVTVFIAMFSYEIMLIWTQNPVIAEKSHLLTSLLICGTALNGLMNIPYGLQLAHGWTKFALFTNLTAIIILVPMTVFMTSRYGAVGGAGVWVILNSGYVFIAIHFMHRRLLPTEKWRWYWQDVGIPFMAGVIIGGFGRLFIGENISKIVLLYQLSAVSISIFLCTAIVTPITRRWLIGRLSNVRLG